MAAEIKPRAEVDKRTKLEDVLPLNTPFTIFIDPSSGCNFQCRFCPTGDRELIKLNNRKITQMDFELFKKIIDDINTFNTPIKLLRLHKEGEPLINKDFSKMVKYAKSSKNILKVDTTTNASLLTKELSLKIIEAGLDRINISIEGINENQYKEVANYNINMKELIDNISFFYKNKKQCEVSIKIPSNWINEVDKKYFFDTFSSISDRIFVENISNCWPNYEMQDVTIDENIGVFGKEKIDLNVCPYIFYSIIVNSDGTISACCVDWQRKLILGDTKIESIKDIWLGNKLKQLQISHLKGNRKKHPVCGNCYLASSCSGDNIDSFSEDILKKIQNV